MSPELEFRMRLRNFSAKDATSITTTLLRAFSNLDSDVTCDGGNDAVTVDARGMYMVVNDELIEFRDRQRPIVLKLAEASRNGEGVPDRELRGADDPPMSQIFRANPAWNRFITKEERGPAVYYKLAVDGQTLDQL